MRFMGIFLLLLISGFLIAQPVTEGGNVTQVDFSGMKNATYWDGVYGEVVLGTGATYTVNVIGNRVTQLNLVAQNPACIYKSIRMHVIAVNSTGISGALSAGNLAVLDAFVGGAENGSATFNSTSTFLLTYGTYNLVPTTYTMANNATSPDFREGYLNDAAGNLVFAADVVDNRPNWNGSTSDYQIMLPNNGSVAQYTVWVDVNYTCKPNVTPPEENHRHILYIDPIGTITVGAGQSFNLNLIVENRGDYTENNVNVYASNCPGGFTCGSTTISSIVVGTDKSVSLPFVADGAGEYVIQVCARNVDVEYCRDFIVHVNPECSVNADCPEGKYCEGGKCTDKKENNENCKNSYECKSGMCEGGKCVACTSNSDCAQDEVCSAGVCKKIECACGYISAHSCVKYGCCSDADCAATELCYQHACTPKELNIVVIDGTLVEGTPLLVQVLDNLGNPVPGALVTAEGQSVIADQNGYGTIDTPYSGLIFGEKGGYGKIGEVLNVIRIGAFILENKVYAGEETVIQLVDSRGNPIAGAKVFINGETLITDSEGKIRYVFESGGKKTIKGQKIGYLVSDGEITVYPQEVGKLVCEYPIILGFFSFDYSYMYPLWLLSVVLAFINVFLFRRRTSLSYLKSIVYSFVPVVLALPNYGLFSICFMANIVTLQTIGEAALIVKKLITGELEEKGEVEKERKFEERLRKGKHSR